MKPPAVVFRSQALADLECIESFIAADDPAAASPVIQRIHNSIFKTLAYFPQGGRLDRETGVREFPVSGLPYLIIFLPLPDAIDVIGVFHTSRPPTDKPRP